MYVCETTVEYLDHILVDLRLGWFAKIVVGLGNKLLIHKLILCREF
jgi:hypothetical protein